MRDRGQTEWALIDLPLLKEFVKDHRGVPGEHNMERPYCENRK
jgi:hypothetical protein